MSQARIPIRLVIEVARSYPRVREVFFRHPKKGEIHSVWGAVRQNARHPRFKRSKAIAGLLYLGLLGAAHDCSPFRRRERPVLQGGRRSLAAALAEAIMKPTIGLLNICDVNQDDRATIADLVGGVNLDGRDSSGTEVWLEMGADGRPLAEFTIVIRSADGAQQIATDPARLIAFAHCLCEGPHSPHGTSIVARPEVASLADFLRGLVGDSTSVSTLPLDQLAEPEVRPALIEADPRFAAQYFEAKAGLFASSGRHQLAAHGNDLAAALYAKAGDPGSQFACKIRRIPNLRAIDNGPALRQAIREIPAILASMRRRRAPWRTAWGRFLLELGASLWIYGELAAEGALVHAQRLLPNWDTADPDGDGEREATIAACRVQRFMAEIRGMSGPEDAIQLLDRVQKRLIGVGDTRDVASCVASKMSIYSFHERHSNVIDTFERAETQGWFRAGSRWNEVSGLSLVGYSYRRKNDAKFEAACGRALEGYHEFGVAPPLSPIITRDSAEAALGSHSYLRTPLAGPKEREPCPVDVEELQSLIEHAPRAFRNRGSC